MPRWELRGIGHLDPQLLGERAALGEDAEATIVIGAWTQVELADMIRALILFGFELRSMRRLDAYPVAREIGSAPGG